MSAKVIKLADRGVVPIERRLTAGRLLAAARNAGLDSVTISGITDDGEDYIVSTHSNPADAVWDLEYAKLKLMGAFERKGTGDETAS